jgi:hypothetical protein
MHLLISELTPYVDLSSGANTTAASTKKEQYDEAGLIMHGSLWNLIEVLTNESYCKQVDKTFRKTFFLTYHVHSPSHTVYETLVCVCTCVYKFDICIYIYIYRYVCVCVCVCTCVCVCVIGCVYLYICMCVCRIASMDSLSNSHRHISLGFLSDQALAFSRFQSVWYTHQRSQEGIGSTSPAHAQVHRRRVSLLDRLSFRGLAGCYLAW